MRLKTKPTQKPYQFFMKAVLNNEWERAVTLYETLPDEEYKLASQIFNYLIKQHKNVMLRKVLGAFPSLDANTFNYKGQPPVAVAFYTANEDAATMLIAHGVNVLNTDGRGNDIIQYAKWSKCRCMIELARKTHADALEAKAAAEKERIRSVTERFLQKRKQGGFTHYAPDFT